jgi:hypothetical protein
MGRGIVKPKRSCVGKGRPFSHQIAVNTPPRRSAFAGILARYPYFGSSAVNPARKEAASKRMTVFHCGAELSRFDL